MKKDIKVNWHETFVGFKVDVRRTETEGFEQYESWGSIDNFVSVNREGILFVFDGNEYRLIDDDKPVEDFSFASSYETQSAAGFRDHTESGYGYFMPLSDFIKYNLNIDVHVGSLSTAKKLLKLISLTKQKKIYLSYDVNKAMEELKKIGIDVSKVRFDSKGKGRK